MTVGTALVIIFGMLCVTFLITMGIGAVLANKKQKAAAVLTETLNSEIAKKIKKSLGDK